MAPRGTPNRGRGRGAPPGTPRGGGRGRGGGGGRGRGRGGGAAMAAQDFTGVSLDYEQLSEAALGAFPPLAAATTLYAASANGWLSHRQASTPRPRSLPPLTPNQLSPTSLQEPTLPTFTRPTPPHLPTTPTRKLPRVTPPPSKVSALSAEVEAAAAAAVVGVCLEEEDEEG